MKTLKIISIMAFVFVLGSCCKKEQTSPTAQKNKLKTLIISYHSYNNIDSAENIQKYDFFYDSITNKLVTVTTNDSFHVLNFKDYDANTIEIAETYRHYTSGNIVVSKSYAHLNANKRIICLSGYPNNFDNNNYYTIYDSSGYADTIHEEDYLYFLNGYYLFANIYNYDFIYKDDNCIQSKIAFVFKGNSQDTNITNMTYNTSLINAGNFIPIQSAFPDFFRDIVNSNYFLGINGYFYTKPNKNLLQTSQSYTSDGKHDMFYEYKTDSNNNITEMCVRALNTTNTCWNFKFEYY